MPKKRKNRVLRIDFSVPTEETNTDEYVPPKLSPTAIRVSQSSINTWRTCRKQYYYKFIEKIERKTAPAPLYKGKIIHEVLEARINGQDWRSVMEEHLLEFDKLFKEEQLEYGDLRNDLPVIMEGYEKLYQDEQLEYLNLQGRRAEFDFAIPLDDLPVEESQLVYKGKIDSVAKDHLGRTWLVEHKSFKKSIPNEDFRFANQQALLYTWAMTQIGFPKADGVLWDYIRTKVPTVPELLKSGGLSKAQKIDTTYEVYLQAILDNKLDPADYEDFLESLKGREINFYRRIFLPVKESMINPIIKDLKDTAKEIKILSDISHTRNLGRHCSYCSFKSLCQAELMGADTEFIRKAEYRDSTYHLNNEEEEDNE